MSSMTSNLRPTIAIVDKNPVVRSGLIDIIARDGRFEVGTAVATGTQFIEAMMRKAADVGVELDAVPRPGQIIVLRMPYVAGADPDPLSGEEVAHIAIPVGATIENGN